MYARLRFFSTSLKRASYRRPEKSDPSQKIDPLRRYQEVPEEEIEAMRKANELLRKGDKNFKTVELSPESKRKISELLEHQETEGKKFSAY